MVKLYLLLGFVLEAEGQEVLLGLGEFMYGSNPLAHVVGIGDPLA